MKTFLKVALLTLIVFAGVRFGMTQAVTVGNTVNGKQSVHDSAVSNYSGICGTGLEKSVDNALEHQTYPASKISVALPSRRLNGAVSGKPLGKGLISPELIGSLVLPLAEAALGELIYNKRLDIGINELSRLSTSF